MLNIWIFSLLEEEYSWENPSSPASGRLFNLWRRQSTQRRRRLTWEGVVGGVDVQGGRVGDARHVMTFLSLPIAEPDHQTEHGHDEQQQEDDAQHGAGRLALRRQSRTDLCVRVQFFHHQSRWGQEAEKAFYIQASVLTYIEFISEVSK